jgi:hypothetical protein
MKMQQTKSYWRLAAITAVAGVAVAFVGSACTVTTTTDDGGAAGDFFAGAPGAGAPTAGAGGATTAGAAGATTAGAAGVAGTAGVAAVEYECDVVPDPGGPAGTPYSSCAPDAMSADDVCALCIQSKCCTEYEACYAFGPGDQCGYGGPGDMGEISCVQACIQDGVATNGVFDDSLVLTCGAKCATEKSPNGTSSKECGQVIGYRTNDLVDCMTMNCQTKCYGG